MAVIRFVLFVCLFVRTAFRARHRNTSYSRTAITLGKEDFGNTEVFAGVYL